MIYEGLLGSYEDLSIVSGLEVLRVFSLYGFAPSRILGFLVFYWILD